MTRRLGQARHCARVPVQVVIAAVLLLAWQQAVLPAERSSAHEKATARLAAIERQLPTKPGSAPLLYEWANLQVYLRKGRYLLKRYRPSETILRVVSNELQSAEKSLAIIRSEQPAPQVTGSRTEGYYSDIDNSYQPFVRYLPAAATNTTACLPMIVLLHGYSPTINIINWDHLPESLVEFAENAGFCLAAPFGRSNTDFQGVGEQDVLNVISQMKKRYSIDEQRIILAGMSMGGMGVWTIGAHHPDLFAGLLPMAARGDYYFWQKVKRSELPSYKRTLVDTEFAFSLLPNLSSIPIFCLHGTDDMLISLKEARHIVNAVRSVNNNLEYVELPGRGHWIFDESFARDDVRDWLRACRRSVPAQFTYTAYHPHYDNCYWIRTRDHLPSGPPYTISVSTNGDGITIAATGIKAVHVYKDMMPERLKHLPITAEGQLDVKYDPPNPGPTGTQPTRGPVKQGFLSPFIFVCATDLSDQNGLMRFQQFAADWYRFAKSYPRVAHEKRMTNMQLSQYNVFVCGEPETSTMIQTILARSPIKITKDKIIVGKKKFPREDNGLYMTYRSPWNRTKLAAIQCGTPWGTSLSENHKYDMLPDYIVYSSETDEDGSNTALCAGFFDDEWQLVPHLVYMRERQ